MERWSISLALDSRSPVITTLNLAGHSSTPLIEHLNLTRCYCCSQRFSQVLTNQWIVPRSSWDIAFSQLSRACCRQPQSGAPACEQNTSAAREIKRELGGYCALKKSDNSTPFEGHISRHQLVSCHVVFWCHFGDYSLHFP